MRMKSGLMTGALAVVLAAPFPASAALLSVASSADTYIDAQSSMTNFGNKDPLKFYTQSIRIPLFRFDFSALPSTAAVFYASMTFTLDKVQIGDPQLPMELAVYDLVENFVENQANYIDWATGQPWIGSPGPNQYQDFNVLPFQSASLKIAASQSPASYTVDVTALVAALRAQGQTAANIILYQPGGSQGGSGQVYSHRDANPAYRPNLAIAYSNTAPIARVPANYVLTLAQWNHQPFSVDGSSSSLPDGSKMGLTYSWMALSTAPGSGIPTGQTLGTSSVLSFNPDVPGTYVLQLTVTNTNTGETGSATTMVNVGAGQHPRLSMNATLLGQIKQLAQNNDPRWVRFNNGVLQNWQKPPSFGFGGAFESSYLLGYLVTGDTDYFGVVWTEVSSCLLTDAKTKKCGGIYKNGVDNTGGLTDLLNDLCMGDPHCAGFEGGAAMAAAALTYDWGYSGLTPTQRQDILNWLAPAIDYDQLHNSYSHSYFRNDGAAITNGVGAAAYAAVGDSTMSVTWLDYFHDRWSNTVQALNIMGAGMGEGNEYGEAPTAYEILQVANHVLYATGENLFQTSPWFQNRLEYDAYAVYPSTFAGPGSMINWPGEYLQTTVGFGDGRWGVGWIGSPRRANGLILCRALPAAQQCSDWTYLHRYQVPDQTVTPSNSFIDLAYWTDPVPRAQPSSLSYLDSTSGRVYIRSDWTNDATWISIWAGPQFDTHAHLKKGAYDVFKHRFLLTDTGDYDEGGGGFQGAHFWSWYHRTVASNGLLIGDPHESFAGFNAGVGCDGNGNGYLVPSPYGENGGQLCPANDGGQRSGSPLAIGAGDIDKWYTYNQVYNTAKVVSFSDNGSYVAVVADITNAYNNPTYTTPGNNPKVNRVWREWVYLRSLDLLLVGDVVESTNPSFQKKSLLHAADRIAVAGSSTTITPDGEYIFNGQSDATIVVDNADAAQGGPNPMISWDLLGQKNNYPYDNAYLKVRALFPNNFQIRLVGGREPSPVEHQQVYTSKVGSANYHYHTHIKDFFVHDFSEGVIPNHMSVDWMPAFPQEQNTDAYLPTYVGGQGRWRAEIEPVVPSTADYFLNVMKPTMDGTYSLPVTAKIENAKQFGASLYIGNQIYTVVFDKNNVNNPPTVTVANNNGLTPGAFSAIGISSLTANWTSSYPKGALYTAQLSTGAFPNSFSGNKSSSTYNTYAGFVALSTNTLYYVQVSTAASGPWTGLGSAATLAAVPGSGSVTSVGATTLSATWAANGNPPGTVYQIQASTDQFANVWAAVNSTMTSASFLALASNATYWLQVDAINQAGVPTAYAADGSTMTLPAPPTAAPISPVTSTSATANWGADGNQPQTQYQAQISMDNFATVLASLYAVGTSATFGSLSPSTTYWLRVQAVGADGVLTPFTALGSTTTAPLDGPGLSGAPFSGVTVSALTANWTSTFSTGTLYYAELSTTPAFSSYVSSKTFNTYAGFVGLSTNTVYYAQVSTAPSGPLTSLSSTATLAVPPAYAPATAVSSTSLTADWQANGNPPGTQYLAQISSDAFATVLASSQTANPWAVFSRLAAATTYWLQAQAINVDGVATAFTGLGSTTTSAAAGGGSSVTIVNAAAASPNPVAGTITDLTVSATDTVYSTSTLTYEWAQSAGPAAATFNINGSNAAQSSTATFTQAGSYAFYVTVKDPGGSVAQSTVSVAVIQTVSALSVAPSSASVAQGASQQFAASAWDQFGKAMAANPAWAVSGGGSIGPAGLFTSGGVPGGPYTVTASSGLVQSTASVTVLDTQPPAVLITAPLNGATVHAVVTVSGTASDPYSGIAWAQFSVDGESLGAAISSPPYSVAWDTTKVSSGAHVIGLSAQDGAGNQAVSSVTVTVAHVTAVQLVLAPVNPPAQAILSLQSEDPNFPQAPSISVQLGLPSGTKDFTLTQLSTAPLAYYVEVASVTFSTSDYYSLSAAAVTVIAGGQSFPGVGVDGGVEPQLGGEITEPSGQAIVVIAPGGVTQTAQIVFDTAPAGGGAAQAAMQAQNLKLIGAEQDIEFFSSGTVNSATVILAFDPSQLPQGVPVSQARVAYFDPAAGSWKLFDNTVVSGNALQAQTNHFSLYAALAILPSSTPGLRQSLCYPNPAVGAEAPTVRAQIGVVDSVEVTVYNVAGRPVYSASSGSTPTGILNGEYYYDVPLQGLKASGTYFFVLHGKAANGTVVRSRGTCAIVR